MRIRRRFYTFVIASHADAKLWRISLPYPILFAVAIFAVLGIITAGIASYNWGRMILMVKHYNYLLA